MRSQRLPALLVLATFIVLSVYFLNGSPPVEDAIVSSHLPPPHVDATPPQEEVTEETNDRKSAQKHHPDPNHPISSLVHNAAQTFDQTRSRQSKSLAEAVNEYRRRYHMHPPPHFDKWFKLARSRGVQMIDEYDTIYHSLLPFWGLKPAVIRDRVREALGYENAVLGVLIRDGKVTLVEGGGDGKQWQRDATVEMMKDFVQYLPDMDLVFNSHDEPRVIVPSEDLRRLVDVAKDRVIPSAFNNQSPTNAWSERPADVNKGDRIDEVRKSRFNRYAHQPTWTDSRASCPADSPSRSLDENEPDNVDAYAHGELGFVFNTTAFSDICNTPSLRDRYGFFERANAFDVVHDLFPVFSQSKLSSFQDILYPSPWYWVDKVPYEAEKDYSWDEKMDKMYWRGSTTGGYSRGGGWRRQHRQRFVGTINALNNTKVLSKSENGLWETKEARRESYRDLFDVWITYVGQCDEDDCAAQREYFQIGEQTGQQDAWAYRHLVDIDGNAFSGRFYAFLHSNSLVHKVAIFREWHDEWIRPWVHYIPLSLTGDEYVETMRYLASEEEGKALSASLAQQGQTWAQKALRKEDMEVWLFRLLLE